MSSNLHNSLSSSKDNLQNLVTLQSPHCLEVVSKQTTEVNTILAKLEWKIEQFEKLMELFKNGHKLTSKQFSCPQAPSVVWKLKVYPNGIRKEDEKNVSFYLERDFLESQIKGEDSIMTEIQLYALDASNSQEHIVWGPADFLIGSSKGIPQVTRETMTKVLKYDGSLVIICEVEYLLPESKICIKQTEKNEILDNGDPVVLIRNSCKEMFEKELFADTVLQVGHTSLKAHRCILGQHSNVFRSMFTQKTMNEAQTGIIDITDSTPEAVRAMLEYVYTGSTAIELMENFAEEILAIADKYDVIPLKEHCERHLASNLTRIFRTFYE